MISLAQAFENWNSEIKPAIVAQYGADDAPALSESWNDYTDSLCKDGELCALQYHHAPAYDDAMPEEGARWDELAGDRAFILDALGVTMRATRKDMTREGWDAGASHWRVTLRRGRASLSTLYSMGSAHTAAPDVCDVLACLLRDAECGAQSFADFCADLGYSEDSRSAEKMWKSCKVTAVGLARLFDSGELADLRELFADA